MTKGSSMNRSVSRGHSARNTHKSSVIDNGKNAIENRKRSKSGTYKADFVEMYDKVTEKDVDLKYTYALDLLSKHLGVRREVVKLDEKRAKEIIGTTYLDEVFYVYVGSTVAGKISIRVQRSWKSITLLFIFQTKQVINQTSNGAFSKSNKKAKSKGLTTHGKRATYNKARGK